MVDYQDFMAAMECIEEADTYEGEINATFLWPGDNLYGTLDIKALKLVAEQYRKVEKERDELQEKFDNLKLRIEDTLEDF